MRPPDRLRSFTLLIPTYNRPADLGRLLAYLARRGAAFPIHVLDSSEPAARDANAAVVARLDLDVRIRNFDGSTHPFEKFWRGSEEVTTEFCALCADDDIVMVDALPALTGFLSAHPDFSAAHGHYFMFHRTDHVGITSLVYARSSIDASAPMQRLRDFLSRYEAVTYAVYRTEVMRGALGGVQPLDSLMARELLSGALTVLAGKVARRPLLYYGRSQAPTVLHERWHPIDYLLLSPEEMFSEYVRGRQILLGAIQKVGAEGRQPAEILKLVDLIALRYLSAYVTPSVMNYLIGEAVAGRDRAEILRGVWPLLAPDADSLAGRLRQSRLLRRLRDRLVPGFRLHHVSRLLGRDGDSVVASTTVGGRARQYRLYQEFLAALAPLAPPGSADLVDELVKALDAYE